MEGKKPEENFREIRGLELSILNLLEAKNSRFLKSNIGIRPHRCEPRLEEFMEGFVATKDIKETYRLMKLAWKCFTSEPGMEPTEPYKYVPDKYWDYWEEMKSNGVIRDDMFYKEKNPEKK